MMTNEIYADGISNVYVTGNVARLDLVTLQPHLQGEKGEPVFSTNHRVIMPLDAFVKAFMLQEETVKKMIAAGVLKKEEPAPAVPAEQASPEE